ncbi:MAG: hypothetical protein E7418_03195 [Ruminococcaceae bacterium]|nr:hypothetical protein [Oscillospiraceae bacterium]
MIFITPAQLKQILQSNILSISPLTADAAQEAHLHVEAGAHILLAPPCKTCNEQEAQVLKKLLEVADESAFVAGQITPLTEGLQEVGGNLLYDDYYQAILGQARFLEEEGMSMIFMTDFADVLTAKCALYAVREGSSLPVCVGMRLQEGEEGLKKALAVLITLQAAEVSAVGITGVDIDESLELLSAMQAFATVPLFAITTAGSFITPEDYGDYVSSFVNQKCAMLGIWHKSAAFAAAVTKASWQLSPLLPDFPVLNAICSDNETMFLDFKGNIVSHQKPFIEIKTEELSDVQQALSVFNRPGTAPVCFCIKDIDVLRFALMHYAGRPAVRSDEYGEILARELGAFVMSEKQDEQPEETTDGGQG